MEIVIAIIIGLCAGAIIYFILNHIDENNKIEVDKEQLKKESLSVIKTFQHQWDNEVQKNKSYIEGKIKAMQLSLETIENQYKAKSSEYQSRIQELEDNYNGQVEEYKNKLLEKTQNDLLKENDRQVKELTVIKEKYKEEQKKLQDEWEKYVQENNETKKQLDNELKIYQDKQKAIIEQFKKDEEARQEKDFYRIVISDNDKDDVQKLRNIADTLHNPTVLYKLIWENYYKNKFSELIGRVAPNKAGCGIYKITNIINGKTYIGQTRQSFNDRWRSHVRRGLRAEPTTNNKLYTAMWEDGVENFTFEILLQCPPEELNEKEKYFIEFFKAQEWGYNGNGGVSK